MYNKPLLATTIQDVNKRCRNLMLHSPFIATIITMWRDLAFKGKQPVLSGGPDERALDFFRTAVENSHIVSNLPALLTDCLVFGRACASLSYSATKGYWTECVQHDLDYCSLNFSPFCAEPTVSLVPTKEQQEWATSTDPRVVEQRAQIDPHLVDLMARAEAMPLEPNHTLFLARRTHAADLFGTSWLANVNGNVSLAELLPELRVDVAKLRDAAAFTDYYVEIAVMIATSMRDHISNYVFNQKMFPFLANSCQYDAIPTVEWVNDKGAESPHSIVARAAESALSSLEEQQK